MRFADIARGRRTLDLDDLERQLSDRTRVVAFPLRLERGRHGHRRAADRRARARRGSARLGRTPCTTRRTARSTSATLGRRRAPLLAVQVLRPAPRALLRAARAARELAAVQGAAGSRRPGRRAASRRARCPHELLAGFDRGRRVHRVDRLGGDRCARARARRAASSPACPTSSGSTGRRRWRAASPTFAFNVEGLTPEQAATAASAERDIAVWWGDYYAFEVMQRLGLAGRRACALGLIHYNTTDEVDRLLAALHELV